MALLTRDGTRASWSHDQRISNQIRQGGQVMRQLLARFLCALGCAMVVAMLVVTADAQFKASIQGTVKDNAGAVVSGATVTVTNVETGRSQHAVTSDEGFYRVDGLAPGSYNVVAELTGFKKKVLEGVVIHAEEAQGVNITIEAGQVSEAITVTATSEARLQTENANVDKTITNLEVLRLP